MKTEDRIRAGLKVREQSPSKKTHIFEIEPRDPNNISTDIVKKELYHHGYRVVKSVGEGAYAKVKLAEVMASKIARNEALAELAENTSDVTVAVKVVNKHAVAQEFITKFLPRELENHSQLQPHKNVIRVYETIHTRENVYIVMDYCPHGDLLDLINQHIGENQRGVGEEKARRLFNQLCSAVQHIHNAGIVHRDIKCENVLLDENHDLKLTDFGFSCQCNERDTILRTSCGSYAYTAPEVIRAKGYSGFRSDIWSLGIILFAMVNGRLPFNDAQIAEMEEEMKMQRLKFERNISFECMALIRKLLQYSPQNRPLIGEVVKDCWLTGKKPIPRQLNRPKWEHLTNSSEDKEKTKHGDDNPNAGHRSYPVCYKQTGPHRPTTVTGTVTLSQEAGETVFLKSRRQYSPKRPNTWPVEAKVNPKGVLVPSPPQRSPTRKPRTKVTNTNKSSNPRQAIEAMLDRRIHKGDDDDFANKVPLWLIQKVLESEQETSDKEKATTIVDTHAEKTSIDEKQIQKKHCNEKPFIGRKLHDPMVKDNPKPEALCPACTACGHQATTNGATSPSRGVTPSPQRNKQPVPTPSSRGRATHGEKHANQKLMKDNHVCPKPAIGAAQISPQKPAIGAAQLSPQKPAVGAAQLSPQVKNDLLHIVPHPPTKPRSAAVSQRRRLIFLKDETAEKKTIAGSGTSARPPNISCSEGRFGKGSSGKQSCVENSKEQCAILKKVSPELPPERKQPVRVVAREQEQTPAERARSCRERLMELYRDYGHTDQHKPLPSLVHASSKAGRTGLKGNPKPPSASAGRPRPPERSVTAYKRATPTKVRRKVVIHCS
uniref:Sucrose non-fermenting protein kinase 1-like isoform X2 n=1 Tax=Crassostrea virginica TaxID=6565 RepID=A0A8B8EMN2_CRAVI|nr:sucrose non-fermenting protein kinase 1-like isoform X2 [Crassostrea virginica]